MSRSRSPHGLTLLEATVALVILSAVVVVTLQLHVQASAAHRSMAARLTLEQDTDSVLRRLQTGELGDPQTDPESGAQHWRGAIHGRHFDLERRAVHLPDPLQDDSGTKQSPPITIWQYTLHISGHSIDRFDFR